MNDAPTLRRRHPSLSEGVARRVLAVLFVASAVTAAAGGTGSAAPLQTCGDPIEPGYVACPDLVISDFVPSVSSDQRYVVLSATVRNEGLEASPPATASGFLAFAKQLTGSTTIPALEPEQEAQITIRLPVDDSLSGHRVKVGLTVDSDEAIAEEDETNNSKGAALDIPTLLPDLALQGLRVESASRTSLRVTFEIANRGAAAPASRASAQTNGTTTDVAVKPLARDEHVTLEATLPVSADLAGRTVVVSVSVDPDQTIPEVDETNNGNRTRITLSAPRPNLVLTDLRARTEAERVVIFATVENQGDAETASAEIAGSASGWGAESDFTPPLQQGDETTVTLVFDIPDSERGHTSTFRVLVDPQARIAEQDEDDNSRALDVRVPVRAIPLPDLALGAPVMTVDEGHLTVFVRVRNVGTARAGETAVDATRDSGEADRESVPALAAGAAADVELTLPLDEDDDGRNVRFVLVVDPDNQIAEREETNNRRRTSALVDLPESGSWTIEIVVGLGAFGALAAAVGGWSQRRIRRRRSWERRATQSEEPTECHGVEWSRKLSLEPKRWVRRRVAHVELCSRRDASRRRRVLGRPVDALEAAIRRYRRDGDSVGLRTALAPVAESVLSEIEDAWLGSEDDFVDVIVHLEGGKLSTKYERFECVDGKPKKVEEWERELEDESDEALAVVAHPVPTGSAREARATELVAALTEFCAGRIDIPPAEVPRVPAVPGS